MSDRIPFHDFPESRLWEDASRHLRWLRHAIFVAWLAGELSEGQASALLGTDRVTARVQLETWREENDMVNTSFERTTVPGTGRPSFDVS